MKIYHQSVFGKWPIEDNSIQAIITSPPYYSLRKYNIEDVIIGGNKDCKHEFNMSKDKILNLQAGNPEFKREWRTKASSVINNGGFCIHCNAWKGQHGLESIYLHYIENVRLWTKEAWRVLKDDGVFFLNLGDSFCSSGGASRYKDPKYPNGRNGEFDEPNTNPQPNVKTKCKMLIPHRIAISLIDDGWVCRNDIVWYSPNKMPESCDNRFSKKFEYIFMFVKSKGRNCNDYYFDLDSIREEIKTKEHRPYGVVRNREFNYQGKYKENTDVSPKNIKSLADRRQWYRENGLPEGHEKGKNPGDVWTINTCPSGEAHYAMWNEKLVQRMVLCSSKSRDIILDPFCGSGTTLKVAEENNRIGIGIDLGYKDIQKRKLENIQPKIL